MQPIGREWGGDIAQHGQSVIATIALFNLAVEQVAVRRDTKCGEATNQFNGDIGARQQRTDGVALRHVAGHLQHGDAHVTADAERDTEAETAKQRQLEARAARTARRAAAPARQTSAVDGVWTVTKPRLVGLVQVVVLIGRLLFLTDAAGQTTTNISK